MNSLFYLHDDTLNRNFSKYIMSLSFLSLWNSESQNCWICHILLHNKNYALVVRWWSKDHHLIECQIFKTKPPNEKKKKTVLISDPPTVEKAGILVLYQKISPLMEFLNFPPFRYEFKDSKTRYVESI